MTDYKPLIPTNPEGLEAVAKQLLEQSPPVATPSALSGLVLDIGPADGGKTRTQNNWIKYWNKITDGRRFASAADMYMVFKQLQAAARGNAQQKQDTDMLVASLRQDWQNPWQTTSTRITYSPDTEDAKLIHNYGRTGVTPQGVVLQIPEYLDVSIESVLRDSKGLAYLQALFGTRDAAAIILPTLEFVCGKSRGQIKVWTPPFTSDKYLTRQTQAERAAGFDLGSGEFHVGGDDHVGDDDGRSRGVRG